MGPSSYFQLYILNLMKNSNGGMVVALELFRGGFDGICCLAKRLASFIFQWLIRNRFFLQLPAKVMKAFLASRFGQAVAVLLTSLLCIKINIQTNVAKSAAVDTKGILADITTHVHILFGLLDLRSHWTLNLGSLLSSRINQGQGQGTAEAPSDDSAVRLFCSPEFEKQVLAFLADQATVGSSVSSSTPKDFRGPSQDEEALPLAALRPPWLSFPLEIRRVTGSSNGGAGGIGNALTSKHCGLILTEQVD